MISTLRTFARRRTLGLAAVVALVAVTASACLPPTPPETLPSPSWWSGSCDSGNYPGARPLGASYRGVQVCGPRPGADGAPNRLVRFFPGAWGELEWQCVELSMRWMYLAYGVTPYGANGKDVVYSYNPDVSGGGLAKYFNGTVGVAPAPGDVLSFGPTATSSLGHTGVVESPAPGDVLSFGPTATSSLGHTGVVESTYVDAAGNGEIHILSQNDTADGWRVIPVKNWAVDGPAVGLGVVPGFLHKP